MSSPDEFNRSDSIADMFCLRPATDVNDVLRDRVLDRTSHAIRSRRRLKRAAMAAALAGCYLAGMLTTALVLPTNSVSAQNPSEAQLAKADVPDSTAPAIADSGKTPDQIADEAVAAEAAKLSRYELLRRAGDQYEHRGDLTSAIQSYKRALEAATPQERAISVNDDTWLLMALKNDQS